VAGLLNLEVYLVASLVGSVGALHAQVLQQRGNTHVPIFTDPR